MKFIFGLSGALLLIGALAFGAQKQDQAERQLKAAMNTEVVDGNLKSAIEQYKKIAQGKDRELAAKALFRIAECYRKLGDVQAQKVYERIVHDFSDQKEVADQAQAQLGRRPSSLFPTADDAASEKDTFRSIVEGPPSRTPGDLLSAVFLVDITPDGHARGPVSTLMQDPVISYWAPAWSPDGEIIQAKQKNPPKTREFTVMYSMTERETRIVGNGPQQPNPWFHDSLHLLSYSEERGIINILTLSQEFGKPFLSKPFLSMDFPVAPNLMTLSLDDKTLFLVPRPVLHGREGMAAALLGIPPGEPNNNTVISVDVSTRKEKKRLALPIAENIREIVLSPDGSTLAMWTVADTRTRESLLFRIGIDGSGYRELYRGRGATLAWAPDGRSIYFGQSDTGYAYCLGCDHDWHVMRVPADGGKEQFTGLQVKGLQYISLSPDGKRLAFDGAAPTISSPTSK